MFIPFNDNLDFTPKPAKIKKFKCQVDSFQNGWCPPVNNILHANFYQTKPFDCKDLLTGIKEMRPNTSHFGEDDYLYVYSKVSPEMREQEVTFKFGYQCSMEIDQYQIEFSSSPMKSWQVDAALDSELKDWQTMDKQEVELESGQRYTFPISRSHEKFYAIRLILIGSNQSGHYSICLHYFNLHGNFYNEKSNATPETEKS